MKLVGKAAFQSVSLYKLQINFNFIALHWCQLLCIEKFQYGIVAVGFLVFFNHNLTNPNGILICQDSGTICNL